MARISRNEMMMRIAYILALRGTCDRAQVGAVITCNGRIISTGYNGSPPGEPHCDDVGHDLVNGHCVRTTHAEVNAIEYLTNKGEYHLPNEPMIMYVTHLPCIKCCNAIVHANYEGLKIERVYFSTLYQPEYLQWADTILSKGGVTLEYLEI
jgi:dCMP deaminase